MLLEGKKVIITGGVTGCGKGTFIEMARHGASVVSFSRALPSDDRAVSTVAEAKKLGKGKFIHMQCDVTKQNKVNAAVDEAVDFLGGLDTVVNSATMEDETPLENLTENILHNQMAVALYGTAYMCAAAFRYMKDTGGCLINYSSYAGLEGMSGMPAYSASKAAVLGYSRVIAKDWGKYNIRVNMPCPMVYTELSQQIYDSMTPEQYEAHQAWLKRVIVLGGELGSTADAANLNVFLASDMGKYIHGQVICVDGGTCFTR